MPPEGPTTRLYDRHGDKLRFLVAGAANTAVGYLLFLALLKALQAGLDLVPAATAPLPVLRETYYLAAQWVAWILAVPFGAFTLKRFVFFSPGPFLPQAGRAYLVYMPGLAISSAVLWASVRVLGLAPEMGQILAIMVVTVFSYLGHKHFTFGTENFEGATGTAVPDGRRR